MERGHYKKVKNDGAKWRCNECEELFTNDEVIYFIHSEDENKNNILCKKCVDEDWLKTAVCDGYI